MEKKKKKKKREIGRATKTSVRAKRRKETKEGKAKPKAIRRLPSARPFGSSVVQRGRLRSWL